MLSTTLLPTRRATRSVYSRRHASRRSPSSAPMISAGGDRAAFVLGAPVDKPQLGVHDWPYWRRHLRQAIEWSLFEDVAQAPDRWTYRTVAQMGRMWSLSYAFAAPPSSSSTSSAPATCCAAAAPAR